MSRYHHQAVLAATPASENPEAQSLLNQIPFGEIEIAHGFDHALGYFLDVYADEEAVVDLCSEFNGLGHGLLLELLVALEVPLTEEQRLSIGMDMPY